MSITIKTEEDIKTLRKGGKIHAEIMEAIMAEIKVGASTLDLDDAAMEAMERLGAEPVVLGYHPTFAPRPFPAAICVSLNDVLVHGIPTENPQTIQEGDLVSVDLVIGWQGLILDAARTVGVGAISEEAQALLDVTKAALKAGINAAQPGNRIKDIGRAIEAVVPKEYGIVEALSGHGVGYEIHEEPMVPNFVMKGDSPEIVPGMVLAIEPMINAGSKEVVFDETDGFTVYTADGSLGAHMEHTVLITEKGPEILTIR